MDTNLFTIPVLRNSGFGGEDPDVVCSGDDGEKVFLEVVVTVGELLLLLLFVEMLR